MGFRVNQMNQSSPNLQKIVIAEETSILKNKIFSDEAN